MEVIGLAEVINLHCQGEIGLLLHREVRKSIWNTVAALEHFLAQPYPVIKVNRKLQKLNPDKTTNIGLLISQTLRSEIWVTSPGKSPQIAEVF